MLDVINGCPQVAPLMYHLNKHYPRCDEMLKWMKNNKLIGNRFLLWVKHECDNSPLQAYSIILKNVYRDRENKKIKYGVDFI